MFYVLLFFYLHILAPVVWYFYESFCCKLSYLLLLFDILHQTNSFIAIFLLLLLWVFFQLLHIFFLFFPLLFFFFLAFVPYFILYLPLILDNLYNCCYLLDEFFFYFLISLPISHFFISLFLVFSLLLIFNQIFVLTKNGLIPFQYLSYFHITNIHAVFSFSQRDLSGYIFCSQGTSRWQCACPCVDNHVPKSLPSAEFNMFSIIICFVVKALSSTCRT